MSDADFDGKVDLQHRTRSAREGNAVVGYNAACDLLEWYYQKKQLIEEHQYTAGRQLQRDWEISQIAAVGAQSLEKPLEGKSRRKPEIADVRLDAMQRVNRALGALSDGSHYMAMNFLIYNEKISLMERDMKWRPGYGLERLKEALDELSQYYGYSGESRFSRRGLMKSQ